MLSIIISYHQESQSFLEECIKQVRDTVRVNPYEIIVVDDHSTQSLSPIEGVTIFRQDMPMGVGQAFDRGVANAKYNNIILMACDTRYADNDWASHLVKEVMAYPKSIVSTTCVGINRYSSCCQSDILPNGECAKCHNPARDNMDLTLRADSSKHNGATILLFHDQSNDKSKNIGFRNIIEAKWLPYQEGESREVPCILGACYATTKSWYQYIGGFWGHRTWGTLEPYISLKSWLFGGSCRVVPMAQTGHIFKLQKHSPHQISFEVLIYNKILVSKLLFPDPDRLIGFLERNPFVEKASKQIRGTLPEIEAKRREYSDKTVLPIDAFIEKFGIEDRKNWPNLSPMPHPNRGLGRSLLSFR